MRPSLLLNDICRRGVIRVGFQRHTPPFSYALGDGFTPIGYCVELARRVVSGIARSTGRSLETCPVEVTSSTREPMLQAGDIDLECGSTTITEDRCRRVAFSRPVFHTSHRIAIKRTKSGLEGARLCITGITRSTSQEALRDVAAGLMEVVFSGRSSIGEAFEAFQRDPAIDAIIADEVILTALLRRSPAADVLLRGERLGGDHYGFMMRRDDPALLEAVNRELDHVFGMQSFPAQYSAWFTRPLPGLGFSLDIAMSGEMQRLARAPPERHEIIGSSNGLTRGVHRP